MFDAELFLGFPVDALYSRQIEKANPHVVAQFIQKKGDYLQEATYDEMRFIGKEVGKIVTIPQLKQLEQNVYSILKKIVPEFPYNETPLYLFPVTHAEPGK